MLFLFYESHMRYIIKRVYGVFVLLWRSRRRFGYFGGHHARTYIRYTPTRTRLNAPMIRLQIFFQANPLST